MATDQQKNLSYVKWRSCALKVISSVLFVGVVCAAPVSALFTALSAINQGSIGAASLQPASGLSGSGGCQVIILAPKVTLTWTASPSLFASGYQVYRATTSGGPYTLTGSVAGRTTTTFTDTSTLGLSSTYYYVIKSTYLNWSSVNSNQATATTPLLCL